MLIEDLVTTGGSSLSAVEALRNEGAIVTDCLCIISYGFPEATESFASAGVKLHPLTTFEAVLPIALERKVIDAAGAATVREWLRDPNGWAKRFAELSKMSRILDKFNARADATQSLVLRRTRSRLRAHPRALPSASASAIRIRQMDHRSNCRLRFCLQTQHRFLRSARRHRVGQS